MPFCHPNRETSRERALDYLTNTGSADDVIDRLLSPPQRPFIGATESWHATVPDALWEAVADDRAGIVVLQRGDLIDVIVHSGSESIALASHWTDYFIDGWVDEILDPDDPEQTGECEHE